MGCTYSVVASATSTTRMRKKKKDISEVAIFVPSTSLRAPVHFDLQKSLKGLVPKDLSDRIVSLRNQIVFIAQDTGGSAVTELQRALEEYLPLLLGLTNKEHGFQELVEFKWNNLKDGKQEVGIANSWYEILSVIHMMAKLTLVEANSMLIPKAYSGGLASADFIKKFIIDYRLNASIFVLLILLRYSSVDCMRDSVDLLLKASGLLEFCVQNVLVRLPPDIKKRLSKDLQDGVLEAISIQALGQGTEIQLGLAVESQNANSSVKRRLACEQLSYYGQAHYCLSECNTDNGFAKKHFLFIKWKYLEAKAAAYYYHGLILDKGNEPSTHISAVCCFLAAEDMLSESKRALLSFCLAAPVTRVPPPWGSMKHLNKKIPEVAAKKSQMYGYLLDQEKSLKVLPDLPEFQLSLVPDEYNLPDINSAWSNDKIEIPAQLLKDHLKDCESEIDS